MRVQPNRRLSLREKLVTDGVESLSDEELLAVFISSGSGKKSCLHLAFDLLQHLGDLRAVMHADQKLFLQVPGLGPVRYVQLQAAKEICRRSDFIDLQKNTQIANTQQTCSRSMQYSRTILPRTFSGNPRLFKMRNISSRV